MHDCDTGVDCTECPGCDTQLNTPESVVKQLAGWLSDDAPNYRVRSLLELPDCCIKCKYHTNDYGNVNGCDHPEHSTYGGGDEFGICDHFTLNPRFNQVEIEQK